MRLLITGGAGFIGSNFIRYILHRYPQYHIVNLDKLTYAGNLENLEDIQQDPRYQFIQGDILDTKLADTLFSSHAFDVIINFAAESHVDRSIKTPDVFVKTNILGTQNLLALANKYQIKKFIQVSTDEVYGSLGKEGLFREDTALSPNSPYSASKAGADLLVYAHYQTYGLPVNITRCSNNYGPYHHPEKLIPLCITNALENKPLPLYGDGQHVRDWLYVEDHCAAIDLVLHKGQPGETYNIGGNNEWTNMDIAKKILSILNKPTSLITRVKDRPGHDRRYAIDGSKIKMELGWEPKFSFETGLAQTIQWYLTNQNWWRRIKSGEYLAYYRENYEKN